MSKELVDLYLENERLELQTSLFRREGIVKNQKRHEKMSNQLDVLIKEEKAGSTTAERLLRNIKSLEDMINTQRKEIPDIDDQYKKLIHLLKERYPEELEREKGRLTRQLSIKGEI